jgi:hypothetical protein
MSQPRAEANQTISLTRKTSLGRLCEILAVIFFSSWLFVYGLGIHGVWAVVVILGLLGLSFVMYKSAIKYAVEARRAENAVAAADQNRAAATSYKVTSARLRTLEETGVPRDVTNALAQLCEQPPMTEEEFLNKLATDPATDLGWERTHEFKDKILKYTKKVSN